MSSAYEEYKQKAGDSGSVWHHFLRAQDKRSAKCKICTRIFKTEGGSTSGLRAHLKSAHKEVGMANSNSAMISDIVQTESPSTSTSQSRPPLPKKSKLTDYFLRLDSMELRVSRMASLDGIAFSVFCTSLDTRHLFKKSGYNNLPNVPRYIKNIVMNYSRDVKKALKDEMEALIEKRSKFSLTFDEWTSSRNRRYINLNIHNGVFGFADGSRYKNLGLIRVTGSLPADVCVTRIDEKLSEFKISLNKDIVAITTDGASVMVKVGKNISADHQLCIAHAIQLGVIDTIYKNTSLEEISDVEAKESSEEEDDGDGFNIGIGRIHSTMTILYNDVIEKTRKVVKIFKNSPTKNDILQKYVKQDTGKELALHLDCKTRWSSVAIMLTRFLACKYAIQKALVDVKSVVHFSDMEFTKLEELNNTLNIVRVTVENLCRRDATLLTADTALKFMLNKLRAHNTDCSRRMLAALRSRISSRRLILAGVMDYLNDPVGYFRHEQTEDDDIFVRPQSEEIVDIVAILQMRLGESPDVTGNVNTRDKEEEDQTIILIEKELTLEQELQNHLEIALKPRKSRSDNVGADLKNAIRLEMALYDDGGNKGIHLERIYKYLMTIPPTSVEAERAFSSAGYLSSKIRSSLKDGTLDALCFLRSYFQAQRDRNA